MIRLLKFLFTGDWHLHKWETIETRRVRGDDRYVSHTRYYCRCEHCGTIKKFD